jgi:prepilin-type N-terminal cleavage/methylation domain-containing protein
MRRIRRTDGHRSGFTVVELLMVLTVISVLATISITSYGNARERVYYATMRADLSRLSKVQESYWESRMGTRQGPRYGTLNQLRQSLGFQPGNNVTISIRSNPAGWSARARHSGLARRSQCALFVGTGSRPFPPATQAGVLACR